MNLGPGWVDLVLREAEKPYFKTLSAQLLEERKQGLVFPPKERVFEAYASTPFEQANVCILGQDPYHGAGQAHGLSFSVLPGITPPPSLQNIYKELATDVGFEAPRHGYLKSWAEQGVFLLNTALTVRAREAGSHRGLGWEQFTDATITQLDRRDVPVVFILWGSHAREKKGLIDTTRHTVIESAHPSPRSAFNGFFGSKPFSRTNAALQENGLAPIQWQLPLSVET